MNNRPKITLTFIFQKQTELKQDGAIVGSEV